ncbi:MAG: S-layer homology domain-containing protein, partial [Oscillibacter sp.]|nr:S-layer homology domain-containing protein [Oscillibacter sp.]
MTQQNRARRAYRPGSACLAALVLTALTLCTFLSARPARAAEWMTPYLEQVQDWGVMRGDSSGNLHEDRSITRAEFVTLVNRAFGYTEQSPANPFTDVNPNDWFAEDISIALQAGYFNGTSPTTAAPYSLVTREQAAVLLGRCLRFQGVPNAANSSFTDMHAIGGWSRGMVQEAAELGIIQGYADGSFKPDRPITRGQMACFLVRALGTLVQEPGEQTSGGVYGNLTITTPGVKLKDTVVTGNLYLTGGVGLGNVELENVTVQGKIVICGGGEAEGGKQSVLLRNVTAGALELDSLSEQFLSVQAEGLTNIGEVTVRTSGYLEDRTEDGLGLQTIRLDGAEGIQLQLAGNIKRVVNLTPGSALQMAQGVADVITMDERAVNATLTIDDRASIRELNLDGATPVTGEGSIGHLNINAPGSNVSMLPDTIYIRPGITGNVNNQDMNTNDAAESSEDPRLLAGYPKARDIAPTSANAVFSTNKPGTVYWGITALMDGSLGEEELMNPGSHAKILRSGNLRVASSNTDVTARITGLTREGSYYISALLVDARGRRSPVKIAAFTTPDDSAPNFVNGYPQNPILTVDGDGEQVAQVMVMATKDCQMYYALFPRGSVAPTAADFRAAALPGNLGYGIVTLRKNTPFLLSRINTSHLQEQTQYDLYLWLNDADNGKSSAVRRVQFTTKDLTPPTIQDLHVVSYTGNSVTLS